MVSKLVSKVDIRDSMKDVKGATRGCQRCNKGHVSQGSVDCC